MGAGIDVDDLTQSVGSVMAQERRHRRPLSAEDRAWLFDRWCEANPAVIREIELTALAIDAKGMRVSSKYLIEKQRYEGRAKVVAVPWHDLAGREHPYKINNSDSAQLARWLKQRHPDMNIDLRRSVLDGLGGEGAGMEDGS